MSVQIYEIPVRKIRREDATLAEFKGKVMLVVNVASKCGLTPQYEGLEKLYEQYAGQGLVVAGFPANDFKSQEPGSEARNTDLLHVKLRRQVSHVQQDHGCRRRQASALCSVDRGAAQGGQRERGSLPREAEGLRNRDES